MDTPYGQDLLAIDMDDLGVRPIDNWSGLTQTFDQSIEELFGKEKPTGFLVYSAELQQKRTTAIDDDDDIVMSGDDEDENEYDIDPETGEKIFRETSSSSTISLSPSNDKWIEEYLSNIESSSSNSILPLTTTQNEFLLEDSDWLDNILHFDESSDSMMVSKADNLSEEFSATNLPSTLSVSIDDDYSVSSSSQPLFETREEISLLEAKLEKIEPEANPMSNSFEHRALARASNQGQLDEEALEQYQIPLTLQDITQSSTEEYNRHLARLSYLTAEQTHIIKDIRRRGKNKIAAQNCRKRKAISVDALLEEVDELKRVKHELEEKKRAYQQQIGETRSQYEYLHRQVLPDRQLPPAISVK